MKKLRRSRLAKCVAVILVLLMSVAIVINIVGTIYLLQENLFYASREQLQQKVYSNLYNFTASDLMSYLNLMENTCSNNDNYRNYRQSEIELYKSKYSQENSNIQFYISDENNMLLLSNDNPVSGNYFSFSSVYSTDIEYDEWYKLGNSDKEVIVTENLVTDYTDIYGNDVSTTSVNGEQITEATTFVDNPTEKSINITQVNEQSSNNNESLLSETYSVANSFTDNVTLLTYYYNGSINNNILEAHKEQIRNLRYDITEIVIYQDEFADSEDGLTPQYYNVDDTRETRSVKTRLLSDGKFADITYLYNGTFSLVEFTNRLSYSALILHNSTENNLNLEYYQKSRLQLTVRINVPYYCHASDIYKIMQHIVDGIIIYKNNIIPITIADTIIFIIMLVYIFYSAAFIPGKEEPVAKGLHRIPTDIAYLLYAAVFVCCAMLVFDGDFLFAICGFTLAAINLFSMIYETTVKLRTKTFTTNTLIYKSYKLAKSVTETLNESTGSRFRVFLIVTLFLVISLGEVLALLILDLPVELYALAFIFIRSIETIIVALLLIALVAIQKGGKQISSGDINYRINSPFLFGALKQHAENLNSINSAVNKAVEERMKSENLKTELITNVSHDLKTPLTSIVNYIDLLKKESIDNSKALEYIEVIDRQSQRLKKLTIDIVEASKAATGNIDIHYENTVLNVILLQTNGEYIERLQENNLTLVQEIPDNEIVISTDGRLLWRIIDNLMNNICKYSMPGTRVYLNLYTINDRAIISFRNISKNALNINPDALTERFVRGDTARNSEGSGLGLSIAKSLTENMGGHLDISIDGDLFKVMLSFPI